MTSAVLNAPRVAPPWRQALAAIGLLWLALLLAYGDTVASMVGIWSRSDTFAHAFLVLPISLWLVWRQRARLASLPPSPRPLLLLPIAFAAAAWLFGQLAAVNALTHATLVALLVLTVPAVLGTQVAGAIAFPLAFLFFMVPIGEFLMPTLMEGTADFAIAGLRLSGVPVYREGLQFIIPNGNWSVVEACSGVRYLIASFMVGTLFAYLNYRSTRRRLLFCAVAIVVPVVANWIRAYLIVMVGHLSDNRIATGVDHVIYGWIFFGIVVALMFFIGARWAEPEAPAPTGAGVATRAAPAAGAAAPGLTAIAALLIAASAPAALWRFDHAEPASAVRLALPAALPGGWTAVNADGIDFQPRFSDAAVRARQAYAGPGGTVMVDIAYYREQRSGSKLISSDNLLVRSNDRRWNHLGSGTLTVAGADASRVWRNAVIVAGTAAGDSLRQRLDLRQIYWVGGQLTGSEHWAAALAALDRLAGRGDEAASIIIYTSGEEAARTARILDDFTRAGLGTIQSLLDSLRSAAPAAASSMSHKENLS